LICGDIGFLMDVGFSISYRRLSSPPNATSITNHAAVFSISYTLLHFSPLTVIFAASHAAVFSISYTLLHFSPPTVIFAASHAAVFPFHMPAFAYLLPLFSADSPTLVGATEGDSFWFVVL
jgi:hypothetical protein